MVPILIVSLLVTATIIERIVFLIRHHRDRSPHTLREIFANVEHGRPNEALRVGEKSTDSVAKVVTAALRERDTSYTSVLLAASSLELKKFNRGLPLLDTAITIAPLLGLLGTVMGMIRSLNLVARKFKYDIRWLDFQYAKVYISNYFAAILSLLQKL